MGGRRGGRCGRLPTGRSRWCVVMAPAGRRCLSRRLKLDLMPSTPSRTARFAVRTHAARLQRARGLKCAARRTTHAELSHAASTHARHTPHTIRTPHKRSASRMPHARRTPRTPHSAHAARRSTPRARRARMPTPHMRHACNTRHIHHAARRTLQATPHAVRNKAHCIRCNHNDLWSNARSMHCALRFSMTRDK